MSKFKYEVKELENGYKEITLVSRWSRLSYSEQFGIALILSSGRHNTITSKKSKGNTIVKSCIVDQYTAEDILKILDKYK